MIAHSLHFDAAIMPQMTVPLFAATQPPMNIHLSKNPNNSGQGGHYVTFVFGRKTESFRIFIYEAPSTVSFCR
jgi:hypothetical protein